MSNTKKRPLYIPYAGPSLLEMPLLNKRSAFTQRERVNFNLIELLPRNVETIEEQTEHAYKQYQLCQTDLDRHITLRAIQDDNETLFYRLLKKYRDGACCFNDDIQGTASVCLATLLAACKTKNEKISDQTVAFVGAGSAGCGIAEQIIVARTAIKAAMLCMSLSAGSPVYAFGDLDMDSHLNLEMVGGAFANGALAASAGRENQIKLTRVILSSEFEYESWRARFEFVGLGDEVKIESSDSAYRDVYRNLGTDLYYYGDHPIREAWIGQNFGGAYWKAGRMVSLLGQPVDEQFFTTVHQAPNMVLLNTGLFNGVQGGYSIGDDTVLLEFGLMSGRDRPCLSGNCYFDGVLDVNEKGNNTPVFEIRAEVRPHDRVSINAGYHLNKTGSAPGSFTSGKHNDNRLVFGFEADLLEHSSVTAHLRGQFSRHLIGLTESGAQGHATPIESRDIKRAGYYGSLRIGFPKIRTNMTLTHERMDRMDALAWRDIAGFDESHPVNSAVESRSIVSVSHQVNSFLTIEAFHRMDEVPYLTGSISQFDTARSGILLNINIAL